MKHVGIRHRGEGRITLYNIEALYPDGKWRMIGGISGSRKVLDLDSAVAEFQRIYQKDSGDLDPAWKDFRATVYYRGNLRILKG
jgi:hypothetical protein